MACVLVVVKIRTNVQYFEGWRRRVFAQKVGPEISAAGIKAQFLSRETW